MSGILMAIENDHWKFVSFPIKHGDFPVRYVNLYQVGYLPGGFAQDFERKRVGCQPWRLDTFFAGISLGHGA